MGRSVVYETMATLVNYSLKSVSASCSIIRFDIAYWETQRQHSYKWLYRTMIYTGKDCCRAVILQ